MATATRTRITLNYGAPGSLTACTLTGDLFFADAGAVIIEIRDSGFLRGYDAAGCLREAVKDGRIKLPKRIRAAIDNGATVL